MSTTQAAAILGQDLPLASETARIRRKKISLVLGSIVIVGAVVIAIIYFVTRPAFLNRPAFEPAAQDGLPTVDERYGYSTLQVSETYTARLCGMPANDGQQVDFYLTNPAGNDVWLRAEVLLENGAVLGSSGILKQGQFVQSIRLRHELADRETPVRIKIIAYQPYTWQSRGTINLQLTIYKQFT